MKALVFHYDMTDRDMVAKMAFLPQAKDVIDAWNTGRYTLAYELEVDGHRSHANALEAVFSRTQDTGKARSTSIGDLVIIGEGQQTQAYFVDLIGFKPITL